MMKGAICSFESSFERLRDAEVKFSKSAYRASDKIIGAAKILFRTDEWDRRHYPHVLNDRN